MRYRFWSLWFAALLAVLGPLSFPAGAAAGGEVDEDLAAAVAALGLGMDGYVLGHVLDATQEEQARRGALADAYPDTVRFRDRDLVVVVHTTSRRILALAHEEEGDTTGLHRLVGRLMGQFGEPSVEAHDRLLYWAWDRGGKLSRQRFEMLRDTGAGTDPPEILTTVKLASDLPLAGTTETDASAAPPQGKIYFILSSPPLTRRFLDR